MAAILATKKTIVIEDNTGVWWNLTLNGNFRAIVDTAATFEDNEIKDLCSIRVVKENGGCTEARFLIYENADRNRGYYIAGIPGIQDDDSPHEIILTPAGANLSTQMTEIAYHNGSDRIEVR